MTEDERHLLHRALVDSCVVRSCLNCENFNPGSEICEVGRQRPPAHVVVYGCPAWDVKLPF